MAQIETASTTAYLEAQARDAHNLAFDEARGVLEDVSSYRRQTVLEARCSPNSSLIRRLAPYVGAAGLSSLILDADAAESGIYVQDTEPSASKGDQYSASMLELDDIVWRSDDTPAEADNFGAGILLMLKICGSLTAHYDAKTITKVANLVKKNIMTAVKVVSGEDALPEVTKQVSNVLSGLLSPSGKRSRTVHVNSNEPVLLINNSGLSEANLIQITAATVEQLQQEYNIWPVRVYAGRFVKMGDASFSVSLLNVSNTEIGGPSMIELLDRPCEARGWLRYSLREVWNGREMLSRDIRDPGTQTEVDMAQNHKSDQGNELSNPAPTAVPLPSNDQVEPELESTSAQSTAAIDNKPHVYTPEPEEAVQEDVRRKFKPDDMPIAHPTWEHTGDGESLLDLVKSQASGLFLKPSEANKENEGVDPEIRSKDAPEDEFVVV